ncbi:carboxymuconolactone decarboxylase family protein [Umezawaea tangerina]|uniref:carboxymuconolactone decarboxylase family protein n=1 Tax=Umezawaea tangerina TaxID=84725 RepID=UPI001475B5A2|nr:carboxymuconolactone decarboxylase family protein [Umezawaea tangerina]
MTRLAPVPRTLWPRPLQDVLEGSRADGEGRENLFGTLAHHPPLAYAWLGLVRLLTHDGLLPARTRELAVLRTSHRLGSAYVWARHAEHAAPLTGLTGAETAAVGGPVADHLWSAADRAVLEAVDELVADADLSDDVWDRLSAVLDEPRVVELLMVVGQCATAGMALRALRTPVGGTT